MAIRADPATITCSSTNTTSNKPADLTPKAATQHLPPPQLREVMHKHTCLPAMKKCLQLKLTTLTLLHLLILILISLFIVLKALSHPDTPPPPPKTCCMFTAQEPHTLSYSLCGAPTVQEKWQICLFYWGCRGYSKRTMHHSTLSSMPTRGYHPQTQLFVVTCYAPA